LKNFIGYKDDEFPNSIEAWKSRVVPGDLVLLNNAAQDHLEGRKDIHEAEYRIRHKDGSIRWIHTRGKILREKDGRAMRWTGIDWDITERKRTEEKIHTYQEQLRSLASELSLIEERERRHIATDLHDHIGHTLALTKIKLGALREIVSPSGHISPIDEIQSLIDQAIHYTRSLTSELSPPVLYELGFEAAMEWLTEQIQDQHHIQVDFEDDRQSKPMDDEIRISLFKAVRELLINVAKHSKANKAKVSTRREDNIIRIIVEDDGVGFSIPEDKSLAKIGGFGLFSIHERLKYLKGDFEVESKPGQGTRITLVAPLTKEENNNRSVT
jgi:PAS domain S-box-containing protein